MEYLSDLNPQQQAAVTAPAGPVLVLAGPGSGKTRVLTHRIAHLLFAEGVQPYHIVAVTFTNKAAGEMKARVEELVGMRKVRGLRIGTFHALCARMLRREAEDRTEGVLAPYDARYLIYDTSDQRAVVKQAVEDVGVNLKRLNLTDYNVLNQISDAKNELVGPETYPRSAYEDEVIQRIYEQYQILLRASNAMDFDDLIMNTVLMLREDPDLRHDYQQLFRHVLVDEFQDTNMAQYELVRLWAMPQQDVFVVGDEDQAIYGFRGADYRNVLRFRKDYDDAQTILLEQNYRSTQVILDAARAVIDRNADRTPKHLFTERDDRLNIFSYEAYDEREEAEFLVKEVERLRKGGKQYDDIAIMYRTNRQSRAIEQTFVDYQIPYRLIGGTAFYGRREVKDMLAYLRLVSGTADLVSFNRVINTPRRGIGAKTQATFEHWADKTGQAYDAAVLRLAEGEADLTDLSAGQARKLAAFGALLQGWRALAAEGDYAALLNDIIDKTAYEDYLASISKTNDELYERRGNVDELRGLLEADEFDTLAEFLENAALSTDLDTTTTDDDRVTLLTLHASKGLEYDVVFLTGLEEGVLPHSRALEEAEGIQEERRLLYVGITRARDKLYITRAFRRRLGGYADPRDPSRFLFDIPQSLIDGGDPGGKQRRFEQSFYRSTQWDAVPDSDFLDDPRRQDPKDKIIDFPNVQQQFASGMRVHHSKFGEGMVIESKINGNDEEVTVAFEQVGIKRLMASFANLNILDD